MGESKGSEDVSETMCKEKEEEGEISEDVPGAKPESEVEPTSTATVRSGPVESTNRFPVQSSVNTRIQPIHNELDQFQQSIKDARHVAAYAVPAPSDSRVAVVRYNAELMELHAALLSMSPLLLQAANISANTNTSVAENINSPESHFCKETARAPRLLATLSSRVADNLDSSMEQE